MELLVIALVLLTCFGVGMRLLILLVGEFCAAQNSSYTCAPQPKRDLSQYRYTSWGARIQTHDQDGNWIPSSDIGRYDDDC